MNVGICWPSPGPEPQHLFDPQVLDTLRTSTHATHLRVNFDHRRNVEELIGHIWHIRARGFEVLPILDFDYRAPDPADYAVMCGALAPFFPAVELGNEPHILHRMSPGDFAKVFTAGARAIRASSPNTQIYIPCESTKPIARTISYWRKVRALVPANLYDVAAIHPYRNPLPPTRTPFGTRQRELSYYQNSVPDGTGIAVTEVGWDLRDGVTEDKQAEYLYEELNIWKGLGVDCVYIYSYTEPPPPEKDYRFGVLDHEFRPRPAAAAIRQFQEDRGIR